MADPVSRRADADPIHRSPYPAPHVPPADVVTYVLGPPLGPFGAKPAVVDGLTGEVLTYQDLSAKVSAVGQGLRSLGASPGESVGLMCPNQPAWAAALYGIMRAGAAAVPLNPALTEDEVAAYLRLAGAKWLVVDAASVARAESAAHRVGAQVIAISDLAGGGAAGDGAGGCAAGGGAAGGGAAGDWPAADPSATAVIAFSSGTTGSPKGVVLTHGNLVAALCQHEFGYQAGPADVFLAALPFFHIYGLSIVLNYGLRHRVTIVTMPRFNIDTYVDLIERYRVTRLHVAPPVVLQLLSDRVAGRDLSSVRRLVSGGAPLDGSLAAQAAVRIGCPVTQGYGMTEASPGITWVPDGEAEDSPPGSVGVLVPGTQARVVDPATGLDAPDQGELWVRGPQVTPGYLHDATATANAFADGHWLRTGDIMRVDADGRWWVIDRLKELIKYNGYQVAPAELEALLLEHPAIADCAVTGVPDPMAGECPKAFVVATAPLDAEDLMSWVSERVAPYKRVRAVAFVDAIPRSASGKVLRRALREPA